MASSTATNAGGTGCHDFHRTLNDFRKSSTLTDVTIYGDDDDETALCAHSVVLAAGSEVLKSTLTLQQSRTFLRKQGIAMSIDGITAGTWKLLLEFMYLRSLSVQLSDSEVVQLYLAAKLLGIKNLKASLEQFLVQLKIKIDAELLSRREVKIKLMRKRQKNSQNAAAVTEATAPASQAAASALTAIKIEAKPKVSNPDESLEDATNSSITSKATASEDEDDDEDFESEADAELGHYESLHFTVHTKSNDDSAGVTKRTSSSAAMNGHVGHCSDDNEPYQKRARKSYKCINTKCGMEFSRPHDRYEHYFDCILDPTSYHVMDFIQKEDNGRITYTDPFLVAEEPDAMTSASAMCLLQKPNHYQCDHCDVREPFSRMVLHLANVHCLRRPYRCKFCDHRLVSNVTRLCVVMHHDLSSMYLHYH